MLQYVIRRIALSAALLLFVTLLTFAMMSAVPGDPALLWVGPRPTPEQVASARDKLGLNRPLYVQYVKHVGRLVKGDWGISLRTKQPVRREIAIRLPATLELVSVSVFLVVLLGLPLGYLGAYHRGRNLDAVSRLVSIAAVSIPVFWLALVMQYTFHGQLGILPLRGRMSDSLLYHEGFKRITGFFIVDAALQTNWRAAIDVVLHLMAPALCLAASSMALVTRMLRSSLIEALEDRFATALVALGISWRVVAWKFALRAAIAPTLTVVGLSFGYLLGGAVVVETVFDWPGIGLFAVNGVLSKDVPTVLGATVVFACAYVVINLVIDIVYGFIDPRVVQTRGFGRLR